MQHSLRVVAMVLGGGMLAVLCVLTSLTTATAEHKEAASMNDGASSVMSSRIRRSASYGVMDKKKDMVTQTDREEFITAHNVARSTVWPEAANMPFMIWNDTLENLAQRWARKCNFNHGQVDNSFLMGQNLWVGNGGYKTTGSVEKWDAEKEGYTYSTRTCNVTTCGHYTQLVWAKSIQVGCGIKFCPVMKDFDPPDSWIIVCNYVKPGNFLGQDPYVNATSCSKCPKGYTQCDSRLCRKNPMCGDLKCKDGKAINTETCLCDTDDDSLGPYGDAHPAPTGSAVGLHQYAFFLTTVFLISSCIVI